MGIEAQEFFARLVVTRYLRREASTTPCVLDYLRQPPRYALRAAVPLGRTIAQDAAAGARLRVGGFARMVLARL